VTAVRFSSVIKIRDANPYLRVSKSRAAEIRPGWRKPLPVRVRINGKPKQAFRINMMPAGDGSFYLYLHGAVREASATKVGDRVTAEVSFDARYRSGPAHPLPAALRRGLRASPRAAKAWKALPPSRQKEVVRYVARLRSEAARARNIAKALSALSGKEVRFMARTWRDGR
jgi:hypothetical protein